MPADLALVDEDLDRLLRVPEAAEKLGVSTRTAYRWIAEGVFPVAVVDLNGHTRVSLRRLAAYMADERRSA